MNTFLSFLHPAALWFTLMLNLYLLLHNLIFTVTLYGIGSRVSEFSLGVWEVIKLNLGNITFKFGAIPLSGSVKMYKYEKFEADSSEPVDETAFFYTKSKWERMVVPASAPALMFVVFNVALLFSEDLTRHFLSFLQAMFFLIPVEEFVTATVSLYEQYTIPLIMAWQLVYCGITSALFSIPQILREYSRQPALETETPELHKELQIAAFLGIVIVIPMFILLLRAVYSGGWLNVGHVLITVAIIQGGILLTLKGIAAIVKIVSRRQPEEVLQ